MQDENIKIFIGDFETTVYDGQTDTQVWAAPLINIEAPNDPKYVKIFGCISDYVATYYCC